MQCKTLFYILFIFHFRSPSLPLIQDTVLKGKLSVPELRVTRLMNRSISCTMKNPKGELFSYPPNSQVSAIPENQPLQSLILFSYISIRAINYSTALTAYQSASEMYQAAAAFVCSSEITDTSFDRLKSLSEGCLHRTRRLV